jgi:small-conductance mechanosensitive channel
MHKFYIILIIIHLLASTYITAQDTTTINYNQSDSIPANVAWVIFEKDSLFTINQFLGAYSPQERAEAISKRLEEIAAYTFQVEDSFNIVKTPESLLIRYKDKVIMSVTESDANLMGKPGQELAEVYMQIIHASFDKNIKIHSTQSWLVRIGLTLLTLAGLILMIFLINRLFRWINKKISEYEKKIQRKRKSVLRYILPKRTQNIFIFLSNILKYIIILIILVLYLPLMFSFLPWTKGIVETFYGYISEPIIKMLNGLWAFLPHLISIIIIYLFARYVVKILSNIEEEYQKDNIKIRGFHKDWAKPTLNIIKIIIYAFALIFMFPHLPGSDSPAFQGVSIFFGVLLSLGSTSAIANVVAGIVITYMRPYMIGDRVKIGETVGDIVEKSLLVTKVKTLKNEIVTIPNATIINTHLWNYTKNTNDIGIILHTSVTIGYNIPWQKVNELLINAAKNTKLTLKDPAPFVLQKSLDDNYVGYEINVYTKQANKMPLIYSDLHRNILEAFNEADIEILSPRYVASRDGNASTVPPPSNPDLKNPVEKVMDKVSGKTSK